MSEKKQERPRLITLLTLLLLLQGPLILIVGLNLLTDHWTFLFSWSSFWAELQEAFFLVISTPGEIGADEVLFYNVVAFSILVLAAIASFFSGLTFNRGAAISWIMSLVSQIATLMTGIGLYLIYKPSQAYWMLVIGTLMVLYLNYDDVRQWFLRTEAVWTEETYD
jgi:hypothetical protein